MNEKEIEEMFEKYWATLPQIIGVVYIPISLVKATARASYITGMLDGTKMVQERLINPLTK